MNKLIDTVRYQMTKRKAQSYKTVPHSVNMNGFTTSYEQVGEL
jgi:hypothetical protein